MVALCGLGVVISFAGIAQAHPNPDMGPQRKVRKAVPATMPVEIAPIQVQVEAAPAPPPVPLTPGQMPPNPPGVSYENGQLTIVAENSTMADILGAVGAITGASIEVPAGAGAERVWVQLGPGPARAVLAALLGGADLDFVIQSADADPSKIQSVLLTPRTKGGPSSADPTGGSQSFASRLSSRFRNRLNSGGQDSSDSDSSVADNPAVAPETEAAASTPAAPTTVPTSPDAPMAPSLSARLPASITEAEAHPTPIANPQQGVPQLLNLFELRRQLQEQQNAQAKATGATR
jgi:hypothetical protein